MLTPDRWHVIKLTHGKEVIYKIFASWFGGYLTGASWKLNSGISHYKETKEYYDFYGYSGSIYRCYKGLEGFSSYGMSILDGYQQQFGKKNLLPITMKSYKRKVKATP